MGPDGGCERTRIFGGNELSSPSQEGSVGGIIKDYSNLSMVSATIGGQNSSKHYSGFTCELVHVFVSWLSIDLGDLKFLEALFDVLLDSHGCDRLVIFAEGKN